MRGLEKFKEYFRNYSDNYILIGGTACTIIMNEIGLDFRATKDLDIVVIAENVNVDFGKRIWEFINIGKYTCREKSDKKHELYRFSKPENPAFPFMIEIFAKKPSGYDLAMGSHLTPLPLADEISSLSAILLDEDYYNFMLSGKRTIDGVSVIDEYHLIPFKAKAWVELTARHDQGEKGLTKHIKKHRTDIVLLFRILDLSKTIPLNGLVRQDMESFINALKNEPGELSGTEFKPLATSHVCEKLSDIYLS